MLSKISGLFNFLNKNTLKTSLFKTLHDVHHCRTFLFLRILNAKLTDEHFDILANSWKHFTTLKRLLEKDPLNNLKKSLNQEQLSLTDYPENELSQPLDNLSLRQDFKSQTFSNCFIIYMFYNIYYYIYLIGIHFKIKCG